VPQADIKLLDYFFVQLPKKAKDDVSLEMPPVNLPVSRLRSAPEPEVKRKALSGTWLLRPRIIEPHIGNQERQDSVDANRRP
jgi:hypothetical protein